MTPESGALPRVDVLEYYWSHMTQRAITPSEVVDWLFSVSKGAKDYYDRQNKKVLSSYAQDDELFKQSGEFDHLEYLVRMLSLGGVVKYAYRFAAKLVEALPLLKSFKKAAGVVFNLLKPFADRGLVNYMGDVSLYCSTDVKCKYYRTTSSIVSIFL